MKELEYISTDTTLSQLLQFFTDRPQLSAYGFARESGISPRLLDYVLKGERSLTEKTVKKILPVMIKYGYKPIK